MSINPKLSANVRSCQWYPHSSHTGVHLSPISNVYFLHAKISPVVLRRLCSKPADVRPPDRFLRALPAAWVPPRQTVCSRCLHGTWPTTQWGDPRWCGKGYAVLTQGGKAFLSTGVQIHTPKDQLFSPLKGTDLYQQLCNPQKEMGEKWRKGTKTSVYFSWRIASLNSANWGV